MFSSTSTAHNRLASSREGDRSCRAKLLHEFYVPSRCWRIYLLCTAAPRQPSGFFRGFGNQSFLYQSATGLTRRRFDRIVRIDRTRRIYPVGIIGCCRKLDKINAAASHPKIGGVSRENRLALDFCGPAKLGAGSGV